MNWKQLMCSQRPRSTVHPVKGGDLRTEFEKDYHRIISSASFRRLQDKTQVFPLEQNDFIRTRLTHSLEVSSFAKSLGQSVGSRIITEGKDPDFTVQTQMDIAEVLQCAGLLHDIGNPPFGHFGESAIRDWFAKNLNLICYNGRPLSEVLSEQMQADFTHFEGNAQAIRVVSKLHYLVDENGMNLTKALLGTLMKYPGSSLEISYDKKDPGRDIRHKKMGYFYAERALFADVQRSTGTNGARHPLTFLLEAADDIAYTTADIEDAFRKGLLDYDTLLSELRLACLGKDAGTDVKNLIGWLEEKYEKGKDIGYPSPSLYAVQNWIISVQSVLLGAATDSFIAHYDEIMAGTYRLELLDGTDVHSLVKALQDIAYRYAFVCRPILALEVRADSIFDFLLRRFTGSFLYYDTPLWEENSSAVDEKLVRLMSDDFKRIYFRYAKDCDEVEKLYLRLLLVTDYVSGMTDGYAVRLYEEMG
ncbi:MAG: deoxyguanosinetriphosphate triphosphohydrolase [Lachnospiraceae bacterium]|nr:deoxyguanosinetriphosphate triphosphohydrolase [Lachnospiraceae bacterium]